MGKPFERTMALVTDILKPRIHFLSAISDADTRLVVLAIEDLIARVEHIAEAMNSTRHKVALFEFGLTPQIFYAFDCVPLCLETYPGFFTANMKNVFCDFIEAAEGAGVPSDVCSTDRFIIGAALKDEFPKNAFFVASSAPCDGTRVAYPIIKRLLKAPMLYIEAPYTYGREAARWYGKQIKNDLIPFLEKVTCTKFDADRFKEVIEESNKAYECMLDLYDAYQIRPCPHPAAARGMAYNSFIASAGHLRHTKFVEQIHKDVVDRVKKGISPATEEKFRVLWIHVPPNFDPMFFTWMEQTLGASVLASSLSATPILPPIDTSNLDTMLEGYAWQGLDMTMSLMRFDTRKMIEFHMKVFKQFHCDCIIFTQHVGCNSICGAAGMMRRYFLDCGIPALFLEMDYNDERVVPNDFLKEQISDFFSTLAA